MRVEALDISTKPELLSTLQNHNVLLDKGKARKSS
jgi:hypothetical protein